VLTIHPDSRRWITVTESEFPHEREGLRHVRDLLPERPPYRAWANFEFRDRDGKWHEVDLLVLGERRLLDDVPAVEVPDLGGRGDTQSLLRPGRIGLGECDGYMAVPGAGATASPSRSAAAASSASHTSRPTSGSRERTASTAARTTASYARRP
jgi:hypothetical protein